jgi:hypothetical protein
MGSKSEERCKDCGRMSEFNEEFDSYYCLECNKWLSTTCDDPRCIFCPDRPPTPGEVKL